MVLRSILLKVSGEALAGNQDSGFELAALAWLVAELEPLVKNQILLALVIGAGNLIRGSVLKSQLTGSGLRQVTADQMGMLGTIQNGLLVRDLLTHRGIPAALYATHGIQSVVAPYSVDDARKAMANGKLVICAGGTGNPLFTTDSAACLRGIELGVDAVVKATQVDGVYSADPQKDSNAVRYDALTLDEAIEKRLGVMDGTAITLCRDNDMPVIVYAFRKAGALSRIIEGSAEGTVIRPS
ncbi:MAG: UMP kinase [Gammaproteobacteria bacterium]|nr:UMP kinase [Gammaproteobacteria bacterium]